MTQKHDLYYCPVCLKEQPAFLSEQVCFSKADLAKHILKGDDKVRLL